MPAAGAPAGLGRWTKLLVGIVGALLGGELFKLLRIDFGLGDLKVTFGDLIAGSHRRLRWLPTSDLRVADHREDESEKSQKKTNPAAENQPQSVALELKCTLKPSRMLPVKESR
jgi:hypothetical protein